MLIGFCMDRIVMILFILSFILLLMFALHNIRLTISPLWLFLVLKNKHVLLTLFVVLFFVILRWEGKEEEKKDCGQIVHQLLLNDKSTTLTKYNL